MNLDGKNAAKCQEIRTGAEQIFPSCEMKSPSWSLVV